MYIYVRIYMQLCHVAMSPYVIVWWAPYRVLNMSAVRFFQYFGRLSRQSTLWSAHLPWQKTSARAICVAAGRLNSDKVTHTGQVLQNKCPQFV